MRAFFIPTRPKVDIFQLKSRYKSYKFIFLVSLIGETLNFIDNLRIDLMKLKDKSHDSVSCRSIYACKASSI